jgi:hypothetical protein
MAQDVPLGSLLSDTTPKNVRILIARGSVPLCAREMIESLVRLVSDADQEIAYSAKKTLASYDEDEIISQLKARDCAPSVHEYFAQAGSSDSVLRTIITNPSCPSKLIESLASQLPAHLLESVLDNRVRILEFPGILSSIKLNPHITPEVRRVVQEIEAEFFKDKKREYEIEEGEELPEATPAKTEFAELEFSVPLEELTLEGLPVEAESRQSVLSERLSRLTLREKVRYALFGNREIRALLIRDSNREVARAVLRSPKMTESEVETIAAMRGVSEDILREIGNRKEFIRSYSVVHNLIRNPKTPPVISQRLIFRLRSSDLSLLTRDRGIPEVVRYNATRILQQRASKGSAQ